MFLTCNFSACDPKLMPTFPQHRNMRKSAQAKENNRESEVTSSVVGAAIAGAVLDQTNNLPAISDLVSFIILFFIEKTKVAI